MSPKGHGLISFFMYKIGSEPTYSWIKALCHLVQQRTLGQLLIRHLQDFIEKYAFNFFCHLFHFFRFINTNKPDILCLKSFCTWYDNVLLQIQSPSFTMFCADSYGLYKSFLVPLVSGELYQSEASEGDGWAGRMSQGILSFLCQSASYQWLHSSVKGHMTTIMQFSSISSNSALLQVPVIVPSYRSRPKNCNGSLLDLSCTVQYSNHQSHVAI